MTGFRLMLTVVRWLPFFKGPSYKRRMKGLWYSLDTHCPKSYACNDSLCWRISDTMQKRDNNALDRFPPASRVMHKGGSMMLPQYGQVIVKNLLSRRFGQIVTIENSTKPTYGQVITRQITES